MAVGIGQLDRRIEISNYTTNKNSFGEDVKTFSTLITCWAKVEPQYGTEGNEQQKELARKTVKFTVRYYSSINESCKIVYNSQTYDITAIDPETHGRSNYMVITANTRTVITRNDNTAPTITLSETALAFGNVTEDTISAEDTFTASGIYLTADIVLTAPTGYEISLTTGTGFTSTITLAQAAGVVNATTIYVRFAPTVVQAYTGNVTATSTGATTRNIAITGTGTAAAPGAQNPLYFVTENIEGGLNYTHEAHTWVFANAATKTFKSVTGLIPLTDWGQRDGSIVIDLTESPGGNYFNVSIRRYNSLGNDEVASIPVANFAGSYSYDISSYDWDTWSLRSPSDGIMVVFTNGGLGQQTLDSTLTTDSRISFEYTLGS